MAIEKSAFHTLSYGVHIISASDGQARYGCTVNTLIQLTSTPFQLSVALNKENATTGVILKTGAFDAVVLDETAPVDLIGTFGFRSSTELDKFEAWQTACDEAGIPYVSEHVAARFSLRVVNTVDLGTHYLFIGEVTEAQRLSGETPMTYAYYRQVKGGKTPPKASSYIPGEANEVPALAPASAPAAAPAPETEAAPEPEAKPRYAWRCSICGHIEYRDELPDGFTCPMCGVGKELFERIEL